MNTNESILSSQYDALVNILKDHLKEDKQLYSPLVYSVKNGMITGYHEGVVDDFELIDDNTYLNENQAKELKAIYKEIIYSIFE